MYTELRHFFKRKTFIFILLQLTLYHTNKYVSYSLICCNHFANLWSLKTSTFINNDLQTLSMMDIGHYSLLVINKYKNLLFLARNTQINHTVNARWPSYDHIYISLRLATETASIIALCFCMVNTFFIWK